MEQVPRQRTKVAPSIYREETASGVKYIAYWREHGRGRTKSFTKLADARKYREQMAVEGRAAATAGRDDRVTFAQVAETYLSLHPDWSEGTRKGQTYKLRRPLDVFGDKPIAGIKTSQVRRFLADLHRDGLAPTTIEQTRAILRVVFQTAVDDGIIALNPVAAVKAIRDPRTSEEKDQRLTDEQVAALTKHMPSAEWADLVTFILGTGLRGGEAAGLTWDRVDFLHERIRIDRQLESGNYGDPTFGPPKTKNSKRWVPMRPGIADILNAQRERHPITTADLVWVTAEGAPMGRSNRGDAWRDAATGLDLPPGVRGWHALRHTCGSRLLDAGIPVTAVAAMLGHTVDELLRTYAHAEQDYTDVLVSVPLDVKAAR